MAIKDDLNEESMRVFYRSSLKPKVAIVPSANLVVNFTDNCQMLSNQLLSREQA